MSNLSLISCCFNFNGGTTGTLSVKINNTEPCTLNYTLVDEIPPGVEIVPQGGEPTQDFWVWEGHHYLTVYLAHGGDNHNVTIICDEFLNTGNAAKYLDVVFAYAPDELICCTRKNVIVSK